MAPPAPFAQAFNESKPNTPAISGTTSTGANPDPHANDPVTNVLSGIGGAALAAPAAALAAVATKLGQPGAADSISAGFSALGNHASNAANVAGQYAPTLQAHASNAANAAGQYLPGSSQEAGVQAKSLSAQVQSGLQSAASTVSAYLPSSITGGGAGGVNQPSTTISSSTGPGSGLNSTGTGTGTGLNSSTSGPTGTNADAYLPASQGEASQQAKGLAAQAQAALQSAANTAAPYLPQSLGGSKNYAGPSTTSGPTGTAADSYLPASKEEANQGVKSAAGQAQIGAQSAANSASQHADSVKASTANIYDDASLSGHQSSRGGFSSSQPPSNQSSGAGFVSSDLNVAPTAASGTSGSGLGSLGAGSSRPDSSFTSGQNY